MLNDPEARALVAELEGRLVGYAELQDGIAEGKREAWQTGTLYGPALCG